MDELSNSPATPTEETGEWAAGIIISQFIKVVILLLMIEFSTFIWVAVT